MDISTLVEVRETTVVELDGPDGEALFNEEGKRLSITAYGPASKAYQKAQGARNRAVLEHVRKGGKKMNDEQQRELDAEVLAQCTVSFNHFDYLGMPPGYEAHKAFYLNPRMGWAAEQVQKEFGDWANFTGGSAKT